MQFTDISKDIENEAQSRRQQTTEKQPVTLQDVWDKLNVLISRIEYKLDNHNSRFQEYEEHHDDSTSVNKIMPYQSQPTGLTACYERSHTLNSTTSKQTKQGQGQLTSTKIIPQGTLTATFWLSSSTSDHSLMKYWFKKRHTKLKFFKGPKSKTRPINEVSKPKEKKATLISSLKTPPRENFTLLACSKKFRAHRSNQDEKG